MSTTRKSFARPANTTAYTAGDLVANHATPGSVLPFQLTPVRSIATAICIKRIKLHHSTTTVANGSFRVHLFRDDPETITNGDNGAFSVSGCADYLGAFDVVVGQAFTDGAAGVLACEVPIRLAAGKAVYGLLEALAAYAPGSAETFTLGIEGDGI